LSDDSDISIGEIPIINVGSKGKGKTDGGGRGGGSAGKEESEFDRLVREASSFV